MKEKFHQVSTLLFVGSFVLFFGFAFGKVAKGVVIEGVEVGGLRYAVAEEKIRAKIKAELTPLTINTPAGAFTLQEELSFSDNVSALVKEAKRGQILSAEYTRTYSDLEHFLLDVCAKNTQNGTNSALNFTKEGFTYTHETNAVVCDYLRLLNDATRALLNKSEREITLHVYEVAPKITEQILRERTQLLSSFSTVFDASNLPRAHNIALAAERISGTVIEAGETFSFNQTVGARTEENGFQTANVIQNGEFIPGVGGGVCQASTTLFNAALRAGLKIVESRPHSLSVSYVPPSLDAMVSSCSDLKFFNPFDLPVYLLAKAESGKVTFSFYGLPDGRRYETESVVLLRVQPPEPKITEGEERVIRPEKEGIASESYLLIYEGDELIKREKIRRDTYAAVQGIYQRPKEEEQEVPPVEGEPNLNEPDLNEPPISEKPPEEVPDFQ